MISKFNFINLKVLLSLDKNQWFHGYLADSQLTEILKRKGDFLVRISTATNEERRGISDISTDLVISLMIETGIKNIRIYQDAQVILIIIIKS